MIENSGRGHALDRPGSYVRPRIAHQPKVEQRSIASACSGNASGAWPKDRYPHRNNEPINKARGKGRQQSAGPCLGGGKRDGTVPARVTKIHGRVGLHVNSHLTLLKLEGWFASEHP